MKYFYYNTDINTIFGGLKVNENMDVNEVASLFNKMKFVKKQYKQLITSLNKTQLDFYDCIHKMLRFYAVNFDEVAQTDASVVGDNRELVTVPLDFPYFHTYGKGEIGDEIFLVKGAEVFADPKLAKKLKKKKVVKYSKLKKLEEQHKVYVKKYVEYKKVYDKADIIGSDEIDINYLRDLDIEYFFNSQDPSGLCKHERFIDDMKHNMDDVKKTVELDYKYMFLPTYKRALITLKEAIVKSSANANINLENQKKQLAEQEEDNKAKQILYKKYAKNVSNNARSK